MITRLEALHYKSLKYVSQDLHGFHVLVGPNASGKSTFLDVIRFLGDIVAKGPEKAVRDERTMNPEELFWNHAGSNFELAVEALIPESVSNERPQYRHCRYELRYGYIEETGEAGILDESLLFAKGHTPEGRTDETFPLFRTEPRTLLRFKTSGTRTTVHKTRGGNDNYYPESVKEQYKPSYKLGPYKSALANLIEDESLFPVALWMKRMLAENIRVLVLNSEVMRRPSPPGLPKAFKMDGSNLPWVIDALKRDHRESYDRWIQHIRTALPDLRDIEIIQREEDKHKYFKINYANVLKVPAWLVSDGTLRMLALTILAYLPDIRGGIYLIEEPENGIHPAAIDTVFQSLSSVYDAQVLLATHSPVIVNAARIEDILCFGKTSEGATDVIAGSQHPELRDWRNEVPLTDLFASGVLG